MSESISGRVEGLYIKPKGEASRAVGEASVAWGGFTGDKHFGETRKASSSQKPYPKGTEVRNTRQISLVSVEEMDQIAQALGVDKLEAEWLSANMLVSGVADLTKLPAGSRLHFENGVGLVVDSANPPCTTAGGIIQENYPEQEGLTSAFPKQAIGRRGIVAWVERPGSIVPGERIEIKLPKKLVGQTTLD